MDFHTFVICAYRESPYLESCVRSLLGQTVKTRILCVTSTPGPYISRIMERYGIPLIVREGKSDIQDDWNFALAQADSEFVTVAHQDDMYGRHYVEELWKAYERWPDMTLFTTDAVTVRQEKAGGGPDSAPGTERPAGSGRLVYFSGKNLIKRLLRLPLRLKALADREWVKMGALRFGNPVICPSCTYRKNYLPDPVFHSEYRYVLDWDCLRDLAKWPGRFICVEKPLMFYRVHDGAETKACIENHLRETEERQMYRHFWPEPVVSLLMRFYRTAYGEYK